MLLFDRSAHRIKQDCPVTLKNPEYSHYTLIIAWGRFGFKHFDKLHCSGFRGGFAPFLRNSTPCRPKGSPFVLFWDIHFWLTDPDIFLYYFWGGSARRKKRNFWSKNFKNCLKTTFLACFFKNLPEAQKFGQYRVFVLLWESSENQFVRLRKRSVFKKFSRRKWRNWSARGGFFQTIFDILASISQFYNRADIL